MKTGPENTDARASWPWPILSGVATELQFVDLTLDLVELQVLEQKLLQKLWLLILDISKLDFQMLEPLKVKLLDLQVLGLEFLDRWSGDPRFLKMTSRLHCPVVVLLKLKLLSSEQS